MRLLSPLVVPAAGPAPVTGSAPRTRRLDWFEIGLLAVFGAFSMWIVALDLIHAHAHGLVWTGTDGFFIVDQMQYLAWIQSAAHHLLVSNLFVLRDTPSDYFQPAILISGLISALGVAPWLALLLWKPVAVIATFLAMRGVVNRCFVDVWQRRAALTLGVLFGSFSVVYGTFGIVGDMMPTWLSWGYPFGLIAVAVIVFSLLRYDRSRAEGRPDWVPGLLGALASTLHPWQGETLILLVLGAELMHWRELALWWRTRQWRRLALPVLTVVLTSLPLLYYLLLGHLDLSWTLARQASKHAFALSSIALGAAPLAILAILGYRGRSESFLELTLRVWTPAALLIYVLSATGLSATPLHAFNGITIPLAVLAVKGVERTRLRLIPGGRWIAAAAIAVGVIPANVYALSSAHIYVNPTLGNANFITKDERAALTYLARDKDPGGVMAQFYLGEVIPARTGRRTFVGDCLWSEPACMPRSLTADALFEGQLSKAASQRFVRQSGARFLLESCSKQVVDLTDKLAPMITDIRHFGCATVYELGSASAPEGPLAELPPHAVVRAPRRQ
ncbi:MAG: hypothetical protein WBQ18_02595 [Solirubrobacteraceae bacterium]